MPEPIRFACPWCAGTIEVRPQDIKCQIFRHAYYKHNGQQIPPHTPKGQCELLIQRGSVWGCAKPFTFDGKTVAKSDYL